MATVRLGNNFIPLDELTDELISEYPDYEVIEDKKPETVWSSFGGGDVPCP